MADPLQSEPATASISRSSIRRNKKRSCVAYLQQLQNAREHADQATAGMDDSSIHVVVSNSRPTSPEERPASHSPHDATAQPSTSSATPGPAHTASHLSSPSHRRMPNVGKGGSDPIRTPGHDISKHQAVEKQDFVGELTCSAFGERILQYLDPEAANPPLPVVSRFVRNAAFSRQMNVVANCRFPDRIRATLLVRVATRFVGQDYHMFMQQDFLHRLDKMYASASGQERENDSVWVCKFFVILALGELYSTTLGAAKDPKPSTVAGTEYFLTAVGLLQDLFEEPSIEQIETLVLFSFYSNALGRVKSAHMYSGMALRSSTVLGLHRESPDEAAKLSSIEREHRRRLWWTVYIFDRSTCSKLGQPISIQDSDISVAMPSTDGLTPRDQKTLGDSADHLIAYINLAQITGYIMKDIHLPSPKANGETYLKNVRSILQRLRKWDSHVPARLRWDPAGGVPRSVASLQLHFNQCIILTTRPVLLHLFKLKNPFSSAGPGLQGHDHGRSSSSSSSSNGSNGDFSTPPISDTVRSLADSCVAAARTSNAIIVQLFVENALATCGYFDAHHLFASTLVLILSAISSPNASDSDAVQTAFQLLMMMRDNGNAIAGEYFARLLQIQWTVNRLFTQATIAAAGQSTAVPAMDGVADLGGEGGSQGGGGGGGAREDSSGDSGYENVPNNLDSLSMASIGVPTADEYDWGKFVIPPFSYGTFEEANGDVSVDPLDNPLLQAFLDHADSSPNESHSMSAVHMGSAL
ncbi:fungal-specific transcription factor domain-containing protein [Microdochium trichocladiopsis]|uniref:Fungal-specific transcription factor domain-containing protein n=1 Tax=Microdochium trichocladiopsis TaxID=1682393 RepID=A0A9P8XZ20_9PEZI|nr:fungal-specific transcription factor domain-containing protein [Microdochium trichocladiopsis]KAH7025159.1 fungal-specific transcription factor domain-containing protein [Microdochium trichocladiopsis]